MRMPRILARYALRETLVYASLGLVGVGGILISQNLLRQLSDVAEVGLGPADVGRLLATLSGILGPYALPVAFLFGVVATVSRLSADAEILAMRSLGVSLAQLTVPFFLLAFATSAATWWLLGEVEPSSRRQLRAVAADIAARGGLIQPGRFRRLDSEGNRLLLVEERGEDGTLDGVFLTDRTDPARTFTVVASRGRFAFDREEAVARIELEDGDIHFGEREGRGIDGEPTGPEGAGAAGALGATPAAIPAVVASAAPGSDEEQHIRFGTFRYSWDMSHFLGAGLDRVRARELRNEELRGVLAHFDEHGRAPDWARKKERWRYEAQLHRRAALSVAPLIFAVLGVTLGLRRTRGASSWGALICAVLVFVYYSLLSFGSDLASNGSVPVPVGLWLANAVFAVAAAGLLWRARRAELSTVAPGDPSLRALEAGPIRLQVVPELEAAAREAGLLEPDAFARAFSQPGPGHGRAPTALLDLGGRAVVIRALRHGGLLGPLLGDRFLGDARPREELAVTAALRAAGAPVPRPALVLSERLLGPLRRCALGTLYEPGTEDALAFLVSGPGAARTLRAAAAAGRAVRRFHDVGGRHADLQVKNLLLRESGPDTECIVIDLDHGKLYTKVEARERMEELMRLYRSLRKREVLERVGARGLARFFAAYCAGDRVLRQALRGQLPRELRRVAVHATRYPAA